MKIHDTNIREKIEPDDLVTPELGRTKTILRKIYFRTNLRILTGQGIAIEKKTSRELWTRAKADAEYFLRYRC